MFARALLTLFMAALATANDGWIPVSKGMPRAEGLGRLVIVTNIPGRDARTKAVKRLAKHRGAKTIRFKDADVGKVAKSLRRLGPEFVAFAVTPETVDINFHLDVLDLCRGLDGDPMPDFFFGYLCARDGDDLMALVQRIIDREARPAHEPVAKLAPLTAPGTQLFGIDFLLHFGHGQAWRVEEGLTGEQLGKLEFPRAPIVFSGACFNGVLGRSYHKCAYQPVFLAPTTIRPEHLMTLNWVHAGASAYFAALEADRGEMAIAEWETLRERACPLGEVIGEQYRLAFTSLPANFAGFPRYRPGRKKNMSFYWVMMRGAISRLLLSDPSFRPLKQPLTKPALETTVAYVADTRTLTVGARVLRVSQGHFLNYFPKINDGRFDHRVTVRAALPDTVKKAFAAAAPDAARKGKAIELTRHQLRHEVWGGRRYVNLQAESKNGALASKGATVAWTLPAAR
ncbi:MAG: hypothetical protein ACYTGZ_16510 [Planctomycetota bacterium]|jgi:hypothetical protein